MTNIFSKLFLLFLEKAPILSWVNGHKRVLSRLATCISLIILFLQQHYPQYLPVLDQVTIFYALVCSALGLEVGEWHAKKKEESIRKGL